MRLNHDLLDLYATALREIPFVEEVGFESLSARHSGAWAPDLSVVLHTPRGEVQLLGEVQTSHLTRGVAHGLLSRLGPETGGSIVLATQVGRPMGKLFRDAGLNYLDKSGNCYLRIGDHYIAVVEGRRASRTEGSSGLKAAGARILFALLVEKDLLHASHRVIGDKAGTSHKAARAISEASPKRASYSVIRVLRWSESWNRRKLASSSNSYSARYWKRSSPRITL